MADIGMSFLAPIQAQQQMDILAQRTPVELEHLQSLSRLQRAQATEAETRVESERAMSSALQSQGLSGDTQSEQIMSLATIAAKSGNVNQATRLMQQAGVMKAHEAQLAQAAARTAAVQWKTQSDQAKLTANLLSGVKDQDTWDQANLAFQLETGQESPFARLPYSPKLVEVLTKGAMTAKERADMRIREEDLKSKEADRASAASYRNQRLQIARQQQALREKREARLGKTGGKDVGAPSKGEIDEALFTIKSDKGMSLGGQDLQLAAMDIAAKARALRKANPGMDAQEATRRAFSEAKASGDFHVEERFKGLSSSTTYVGAGKSKDTPIPLSARPDPKSLLKGRFYQGPGGVFQWDGTKAIPLPTQSPADDVGDDVGDDDE